MIKHDDKWGTVCDDSFDATDAQAACKTLGFAGGLYSHTNPGFSESSVPIWMDEVDCDSSTTNFLQCEHEGWNDHDCSHGEDVLLDCRRICIEFYSNCDDCTMCGDSKTEYSSSNSWLGDPIRVVFLNVIDINRSVFA